MIAGKLFAILCGLGLLCGCAPLQPGEHPTLARDISPKPQEPPPGQPVGWSNAMIPLNPAPPPGP